MTTSELKIKIFRQIDTLEKSKLENLYGALINYFNGEKDITEWDKLSENQKQGLFDAMDEIDAGKKVLSKIVIDKFRKKYSNA